ncbi:TPA: hypothetical protein LT061_004965 [Salmonella enterica subsp. enterica serovar Blitta]|nr:hypothetical protein [Salmonella enterica subsp. enterica]HBM0098386.1 hypothetical protein [Salmonella enterica subsp. enterica serovar Blitta]
MEQSVFYREVAHRTECLQVSVSWMAVARWCDSPENQEVLWQICRDTAAFMVPPAEGGEPAWRKALWARLQETSPDALRQLLALSGGAVLHKQLARGEVYAGAVLHSLLKSWLSQYGRGKERMRQATQGVMSARGDGGGTG